MGSFWDIERQTDISTYVITMYLVRVNQKSKIRKINVRSVRYLIITKDSQNKPIVKNKKVFTKTLDDIILNYLKFLKKIFSTSSNYT